MFVYSLDVEEPLRVDLVGGKASSLNLLLRHGIPVPDGFAISTNAFETFVAHNGLGGLLQDHLGVPVEKANYGRLKRAFMDASFPEALKRSIRESFIGLSTPYVAVRSSAVAEDGGTASWAGQLESFTYTDEEHLFDNIKRCWFSAFDQRALFYKRMKRSTGDIAVGVVVQSMVASEVSGVAFSIHPLTKEDVMLVEAGLGLCEALVEGEVDPDRYTYDKQQGVIREKVIARQQKYLSFANGEKVWNAVPPVAAAAQKLADDSLNRLAAHVVSLERLFGRPVDVEWALEDGHLFILQARPITT